MVVADAQLVAARVGDDVAVVHGEGHVRGHVGRGEHARAGVAARGVGVAAGGADPADVQHHLVDLRDKRGRATVPSASDGDDDDDDEKEVEEDNDNVDLRDRGKNNLRG